MLAVLIVCFLLGAASGYGHAEEATKSKEKKQTEKAKTNKSSPKEKEPAKKVKGNKLYWQTNQVKPPPMDFGKSYSYQFKDDGLENPQWQLFHGKLPDGLKLTATGKLYGVLAGEATEFKGKTFQFYVKAWDQSRSPKIIIYDVHLAVRNENKDKLSKKPKPAEEKKDIRKLFWNKQERRRFIAGYEMTQIISDKSWQKGFVDLYFSHPMPFFKGKTWERFFLWGSLRLTSIPKAKTPAIKTLPTEYVSDLSNMNISELAQTAEFLVGFEYALFSPVKIFDFKFTLSFLGAMGGIKPPEFDVANVPVYIMQEEDKAKYTDKAYVAFLPMDRKGVYRQAYIGFRLKTYLNKEKDFPAIFDVTYGLNEAASGGSGHMFNKSVARIDGFVPLMKVKKDIQVYVFGTLVVNFQKSPAELPIIYELAVDTNNNPIGISDPLVQRIGRENDRDYYRIGLGIDFYYLFKEK